MRLGDWIYLFEVGKNLIMYTRIQTILLIIHCIQVDMKKLRTRNVKNREFYTRVFITKYS